MFICVDQGASGAFYECNRVLTRNFGDTFTVTMERKDGDTITVEFDKSRNGGVYVMSNEGRTVQCLFRRDGHIVSGAIPEKGIIDEKDSKVA